MVSNMPSTMFVDFLNRIAGRTHGKTIWGDGARSRYIYVLDKAVKVHIERGCIICLGSRSFRALYSGDTEEGWWNKKIVFRDPEMCALFLETYYS